MPELCPIIKRTVMRNDIKRIAAILCLAVAPMAHAQTMDEIHALQKEKLIKNLKESIDKDSANANALTPKIANPTIPASRNAIKEMELTGLFGVGDEAEAKIAYDGQLYERKIGMDLAGWKLSSFRDLCVVMVKAEEIAPVTSKKKPVRTDGGVRTASLCIKTMVRDYAAGKNEADIMPVNSTLPTPGSMPMPASMPNGVPGAISGFLNPTQVPATPPALPIPQK
jgi:hypothetical protein